MHKSVIKSLNLKLQCWWESSGQERSVIFDIYMTYNIYVISLKKIIHQISFPFSLPLSPLHPPSHLHSPHSSTSSFLPHFPPAVNTTFDTFSHQAAMASKTSTNRRIPPPMSNPSCRLVRPPLSSIWWFGANVEKSEKL